MATTLSLPQLLPDFVTFVQALGLFFGAVGIVVLFCRLVFVACRTATTRVGQTLDRWGPSRPARAEDRDVAPARRAGEEDMRTAWLLWQLRPEAAPRTIRALNPKALTVTPRADWTLDQFREHGRDVWAVRPLAVGNHRRQEVEARLDRVAATIYELTDEPFDAVRGQTSDQYLYHQDRRIRDAYLEGGSRAVERIMDTIAAARARARQDAATGATAQFLAQQRNAAFEALRKTHRPTRTRDAHAAWEAEAEGLRW